MDSVPVVGKIPWRRKWQPTPVFLPGKSHRRRSLAGYSPWGHKELDTERLNKSYWDSQVVLVVKNPLANSGDVRDMGLTSGWGRSPREGHGHPLPYACLENPMDKGAWQTTVHGVSRVRHNLVTWHTCTTPAGSNNHSTFKKYL